MANRTSGKPKLTPEIRQQLEKMVAEAGQLVYGEVGFPVWGTTFLEIEDDAREVGEEFMRLLMQQSTGGQAQAMPKEALATDSGEEVQWIGVEERTLETESGRVTWSEPKAYLPKSRKAFFPSVEGLGGGG